MKESEIVEESNNSDSTKINDDSEMVFSKFAKTCFQNLKTSYNTALNNHPYIVQAVQVSVLMGFGDVIAQTTVERTPFHQLNLTRTTTFSGIGFFFVGPTLCHWYKMLDRIVKTQHPISKAISKTCCDQLLFAPIFIAILTSMVSRIQGNSWPDVVQRLKADYPDILITNYCVWPAVQFLNFRLIPLNYQVIFVQMVALVWNTYFSWKLAKGNLQNKITELP